MLRHSFVLIYRNFKRFKSTFFINLIGLSSALACVLFIYLWINDEFSMDNFHENSQQLYQVRVNYQFTDRTKTNLETDGILAEALAKEMPEVEFATVATPVHWFGKFTLSTKGNNHVKAVGRYAGEDFFNIFSYHLLQGNSSQVLADKSAIVISKELALNLFNTTENVVGKVIQLQHDKQFLVSGIFDGTPYNSTEQFDFVLPFENFQESNPRFTEWDQRGPATYLVLHKDTDIDQFNQKISAFYQGKIKESNITLFVSRYADNYLFGNYENGIQAGGRIEYLRLFGAIAVVILIIACINFMNLSTAKASRRIKEVGVKKALGANRQTLISQYMGESILMTVLSLFAALLLVSLLLPIFNDITGKAITLSFNFPLLLSLICFALFTGLIAGSYPALYLSGFNPITVLKGKRNISAGELWARRGLVIFQFVLSIILMVAVVVVYQQIEFVQTKNIGYDKENVIIFDMEGKVSEQPESFIQELKQLTGIVNASSTNSRLIGSYGATTGLSWEGKHPDENVSFEIVQVHYELIETLGLDIVSGRTFSRRFSTDHEKLIFNEAAIEAMGLEDPIGITIEFWGETAEIIGVVKDFHIESLHESVKPLMLRLSPANTNYIVAKIEAGKERETIGRLQSFYKDYNPGFVLDYQFLDHGYQALYEAENRVAALSRYFAGLAILISCLGLFGLAAFTAERRLKEMGIRKILGSSEFGIIYLLSTDFTKMVLAAILIALPVSFFIVRAWLNNFAYKIPLAVEYFIGAGVAALVTAWLTVGIQAVKAARINPSECLKDD